MRRVRTLLQHVAYPPGYPYMCARVGGLPLVGLQKKIQKRDHVVASRPLGSRQPTKWSMCEAALPVGRFLGATLCNDACVRVHGTIATSKNGNRPQSPICTIGFMP